MSETEFVEKLKEIDIELSEDQILKFKNYAEFLLEYNAKVNLTAIRNIEEVYMKHFFDSSLLLKYFKLSNQSVLDIGTGAGFPGVVLKIINPEIKLTLLESNGKKAKFLNCLKDILKIDYEVINDRAEKFIVTNREKFDIVTARAVTAMPALVELSLPYVKVGGHLIPYKANIDDSLENGLYAIEKLGGEVENIYRDSLPLDNAIRTFIIICKKCKTDEMFPRHYEKIIKKPLQKNI